jgi:hypothetical protein
MDTDDISKPDRCEKQLKRFEEKPELAIVGSHIDEFVGDPSNVISQRKVPTDSESIYEYAKKRSAFNHPAVMYRKSAVLVEGGYSDLKRNQDVDLFGRMLFKGYKAENIDEALLWFRSSDELAARRKSWENTKSYIATIKKFWKMGYSSFSDYAVVAVAQTGMYIMPAKCRTGFIRSFLRSDWGTRMSRKAVVYIGEFDLRNENVQAHLVKNNGKLLKQLGYEVFFYWHKSKLQ